MNESILTNLKNREKPIDCIKLINKYCIYSTFKDDPIYQNKKNNITEPILCCGEIESFNQNVYNFQHGETVLYIYCKLFSKIELSSQLIFKNPKVGNQKVIAIFPYASYAMKILRKINPKLGHNIAIIGLNFFTLILETLFKIAGSNVFIIDLEKDLKKYNNSIQNSNLINVSNAISKRFKKTSINSLLYMSELHKNLIINEINIKSDNVFDLSQISLYDKGYNDLSYNLGVKYPYPYVRWDYRKNLEYFIYLIKENLINLDYFEFKYIEVETIKALKEKIEDLTKNNLFLFKILNPVY